MMCVKYGTHDKVTFVLSSYRIVVRLCVNLAINLKNYNLTESHLVAPKVTHHIFLLEFHKVKLCSDFETQEALYLFGSVILQFYINNIVG